jgi:multidrug efflux pump
MTGASCTTRPPRSCSRSCSQIEGVGQVNVGGGALPAVRVDVNPTALNSYGLGLEDVRTAMLSRPTPTCPRASSPTDGDHRLDILANDQLLKAADYRRWSSPIATARRALSDVADVRIRSRTCARGLANGKPSVLLIIFRQPGANIIETVDRSSRAAVAQGASIPAGINF